MFLDKTVFLDYYLVVKETIEINTLNDKASRALLASKINCSFKEMNSRKIFQKIYRKNVFIFGASPTLEDDVKELKEILAGKHNVSVISANGATEALINSGMYPDIVVTDLDGSFKAIFKAALNGAVVVLHAHGDNILALRKYLDKLLPYSTFTTQLEPEGCLENFGGFTDGDRAVFLALKYGASRIFLVAMDFGEIVGKYSKPWLKSNVKVWEFKKKKFKIAKTLLAKHASAIVFTVGKSRIEGVNVKHLNYSEVENIIQ